MTVDSGEFAAPPSESSDPRAADLVGDAGRCKGVACEEEPMEASFVIVNGGDADDHGQEEVPDLDLAGADSEISAEVEGRLENGSDCGSSVENSESKEANFEEEDAEVCAKDEKIEAFRKEDNNGVCTKNEEEKNPVCIENEEEKNPVCTENEEEKNGVCTENEEDKNGVCTENEEDKHGVCTVIEEEKHGVCTEKKEDKNGVCTENEEEKDGVCTENEEEKDGVCTENEEDKHGACTENEEDTNGACTEKKEDKNGVCPEKEQEKNRACTENEEQKKAFEETSQEEETVEAGEEERPVVCLENGHDASNAAEARDVAEIGSAEIENGADQESENVVVETKLRLESEDPEVEILESSGAVPTEASDPVELRPDFEEEKQEYKDLDALIEGSSIDATSETMVVDESEPAKGESEIVSDDVGLPSETIGAVEEAEPEAVADVDQGIPVDHINDLQLESDVSNDPVESSKSLALLNDDKEESSSEMKPELDGRNTSSSEVEECTNRDDDEEAVHVDSEATEGIQDSPSLAADREKVEAPVTKEFLFYLVKVPRFNSEDIEKELQHTQMRLDEKTNSRNSIQAAVAKQRETVKEFGRKLEAARSEERAARNAVSAKRKEIDEAQLVIDKMKNATSIDDIEDQINNMEHMIQHETMPLKQEKQYINEIKKLRQRRDELSLNMGSQAEIQKAFDQKDQIGERLKLLRKESDSLRTELSLAEGRAKAARKEHDDEYQCLKDLQQKLQVANQLRNEAFSQRQKLRNDLKEKQQYFNMYRDDIRATKNYIFSGDTERLQDHCSNQVEKMMQVWNNDEEFRKEYIKINKASTWRRFKTLDGRSLSPDEVLRSTTDKSLSEVPLSTSSIDTPVPASAPDTTQENSGMLLLPRDKGVMPVPKVVQKNPSAHSKKSAKASFKETSETSASNREEEEKADIRKKLSKEEEELARKEEELRKEKVEAEWKECLKLEQRAKAKEAEERKRRKAEKAQAKAEYKAQKEAEEREKRRAKKEKRKGGMADVNGPAEGENAPITDSKPPEIPRESETTVTTISKRSLKPPTTLKRSNKIQPVPLPLRNRSKRKMQTWMWFLLVTLLVLALFFAGNYISPSKFVLPSFSL